MPGRRNWNAYTEFLLLTDFELPEEDCRKLREPVESGLADAATFASVQRGLLPWLMKRFGAQLGGTVWYVRTSLAESIPLRRPGSWQVELAIKLAQRHSRVLYLPSCSHKSRTVGIWTALRTWFRRDAHTDPDAAMLGQMAAAKRFNRWMADTLRPYVHGRTLEVGAGIGNMAELLSVACEQYVATDTAGEHLRELQARLAHAPHLTVQVCDAATAEHYRTFTESFDTVVCLNVLEHIEDDHATLANIWSALRPGGRAIVLVPQGARAFGSLDEVLHHKRRYSRADLASKMARAGFRTEELLSFNRVTFPGWILNARILRRRTLSNTQLRLFDLLVPIWKRIDPLLPWPPTSLIAVGVKER